MLIDAKDLKTNYLPGFTIKSIREYARTGIIPAVRVRRKFMFDPTDVLAALKKHGAGGR